MLQRSLSQSPRITSVRTRYLDETVTADWGLVDLVHGFDNRCVEVARRLRAPLVMTRHISPLQFARQGWRTGKRLPWYRVAQAGVYANHLLRSGRAFQSAAAVIAPSRNTHNGLVRMMPWRQSRFHMIENGVETDGFPLGTKDEGYGLFVGRFERVKGADIAVAAFERLGFPLRMVGSGSLEASLRRNAPPNVSFAGGVNDAELSRLYRGASVSLFPSESEGYPFVVLEALSSGSPVVSSNSFVATSPAKELIHWVPFGVCSPHPEPGREKRVELLADAIRVVWKTKTPENARQRHEIIARHYTWSSAVEAMIDVYEGVVRRDDGTK